MVGCAAPDWGRTLLLGASAGGVGEGGAAVPVVTVDAGAFGVAGSSWKGAGCAVAGSSWKGAGCAVAGSSW
ncbi:MAG TPA: hypothetical protein P5284_06160, partial [Candidatus Contendobacter sp.]|nr:hypothetical protein [Candidatus Contendobacter sp.]